MKKLLKVVVFCSLVAGLVAAAEHVSRLEAKEEVAKALQEAEEAREWVEIVETEAAELVARSRRERDSQTNP